MPNTFAGRPLLDPARLLAVCLDNDLPTFWHGECTVASCPPGREPGKASFLMSYGDVRALPTGADSSLVLSNGDQSVTLQKWTVVEAFAPIAGAATNLSDDTTYLVRAVDRRYHLRRSPFSQAYNVTTDGSTYVSSTTNSGTPWTWATMFANLWAKLPGPPTAPTLPFTPDGTPQNFNWFGCPSAWGALNDLLDRLACIVCYDPIADTFTVERLGTADAAAAAFEATAKSQGNLNWDTLPVAFERADKPESLKVVFRRYPAPSAGSDPTYAVTTSLSGTGVVAGTVVQIEDDACAIGATGTPSNSAALATRAAERVADYKRKLAGYDRRLIRSYRGLWTAAVAAPGSTYAALTFEDRGAGYATEIQAKPDARLQEWRAQVPGVDTSGGGGSATVSAVNNGAVTFSTVNTFYDICSMTLTTGTYVITAHIGWFINQSVFSGTAYAYIDFQFWDDTNSAQLGLYPASTGGAVEKMGGTTTIPVYFIVTSTVTLKFRGRYSTVGSPTVVSVNTTTAGPTTQILKIA